MISSKDLLINTGISRATLNNYISYGLLSKPLVMNPGLEGGGARQLGYFPDDAVNRVDAINKLKGGGMSLAEIVAHFGGRTVPGKLQAVPTALPGSGVRLAGDDLGRPTDEPDAESMLDFLSRRDDLIGGLLRSRLPVLTQLAVLVADLQGSVNICSELPAEEYFELINEIRATMGPIFRKYAATCGKHVGDGMVYYFLRQADSNYLFNALLCSQEIKLEMCKISKAWQTRKQWFNELYLNTGISEGQEWLGIFQTETSVEFVVLGETMDQAARISDFARHGAIWASKSLIGKLSGEERERVSFGVRRKTPDGREINIPSSFALLSSLVESGGAHQLRNVASLPVTEVTGISGV